MSRVSLSAVLITKNEEAKIRRCLDSVKGLSKEIIIVDDESADKTPQIAREEYGAKVIVHASGANFDRQRNIGIEEASCDWILQLDADEEVPLETSLGIEEAILQGTGSSAFTLKRCDCVFGTPLKYAKKEKAVKLFKKGKARYTGRKIHETLQVDGKVQDLELDVLHYNFDSISEVISRWNYYTDAESSVYLDENPTQSLKSLKKRLTYKPFKLFYKHYFKHKAYKDGIYGLVWATLHVVHPLLFWLKVLEKAKKENKLK